MSSHDLIYFNKYIIIILYHYDNIEILYLLKIDILI